MAESYFSIFYQSSMNGSVPITIEFLDSAHLEVRVDGNLKTPSTLSSSGDYTVDNTNKTVVFVTPPVVGSEVKVIRSTPTSALTDWPNQTTISGQGLDVAANQPLYALMDHVESSATPTEPLARVYNVKDYGANGDGIQDDTAACQSAINATPENGGVVLFPVGVYKITDTLLVTKSGMTIRGEGTGSFPFSSGRTTLPDLLNEGTVIWSQEAGADPSDPNQPAIGAETAMKFEDAERLTLEGITFMGPGMNQASGGGVSFVRLNQSNLSQLTVQKVLIQNVAGNGLYMSVPILTTLDNVTVRWCAGHGFLFRGGTSTNLRSCYAVSVLTEGFHFDEMVGCVIDGCYVEGAGIGFLLETSSAMTLNSCSTESLLDRSVHYEISDITSFNTFFTAITFSPPDAAIDNKLLQLDMLEGPFGDLLNGREFQMTPDVLGSPGDYLIQDLNVPGLIGQPQHVRTDTLSSTPANYIHAVGRDSVRREYIGTGFKLDTCYTTSLMNCYSTKASNDSGSSSPNGPHIDIQGGSSDVEVIGFRSLNSSVSGFAPFRDLEITDSVLDSPVKFSSCRIDFTNVLGTAYTNRDSPVQQRGSSTPTVGTWEVGAIIWNDTPTTPAGNIGWVCTTAGTFGVSNPIFSSFGVIS